MPFVPLHSTHSAGGRVSAGCASSASVKLENLWRRRIRNSDISWYANYVTPLAVRFLITSKGERGTCLLAEAYAWTGVEGEEYEGVGDEVFAQSVVDEAVWVEFVG